MRGLTLMAILIAATFILATPASATQEARSISMPAISADGQTVYFGCWGDIWAAPIDGATPARRLTDNVANDVRPIISPDGKWIAFYSDRYGNADVFVMPVEGGAARRLTYDSAYDFPYGWNTDSSAVLFYARRGEPWGYGAFEVSLDGSTPRRLSLPEHNDMVNIRWVADTETLVYARGPGNWARKRYHGSGAYDIWTLNTATGEHSQWTDYDGKDLWPMPSPDGRTVYFVSNRDGTENIWRLNLENGSQSQVTYFSVDGPRWPQISPDGDQLVFEVFGELYVKDVAGGKSRRVPIRFADDPKFVQEFTKDFSNNISEFYLSPNGKYFVVAVLGDLYLMKNPDEYEEEPDQDLSRTRPLIIGPGRERDVTWHPEEMRIAYVSDRAGQFDLYTLDLITMEERRLTDTPVEEVAPEFAPKGNTIAYYSGSRQIMTYDLDQDQAEVLYEGRIKWGPRINGYAWAPDGYWLAVQDYILDYQREVYLVNIEDREPVQVTRNASFSGPATWSPDGKYLAYSVATEIGGEVMLVELNPEEETYDLELLFPDDLPDEDEDAADSEDAVAEADEEKAVDEATATDDTDAEDASDGNNDEENEDKLEPLTINFDQIHKRGYSVSSFNGEAWGPFFDPNSEYIVFVTNHSGDDEFWSVSIEEGELERLGRARDQSGFQFTQDGKRLYFQSGDRVQYWEMSGQSQSGSGSVAFTTRIDYNQQDIWEQVLYEGWRILKFGFYDPAMNNVDWDDVLERYLPRVREVGTPEEYGSLYREMLGELGRSHLGYSGYGDSMEAPADNTGELGVSYDEQYPGPGWRIAKVLKNGPADRPGVKLNIDDVITYVGGVELTGRENRAKLLNNTAGDPVVLTVELGKVSLALAAENAEDGAVPETTREVVIKPCSQGTLNQLHYETWVQETRNRVEELSKGRIAYQHIQRMYPSSTERFYQELFGEHHDAEALVVDVRFNRGGSTAVDIMHILNEEIAYWRAPRDEPDWQPGRQFVWQGPIVVLINSTSFSNAEILAHVMKDLGLATIVGEDTPGGVISTSSYPMLDGSSLSIPAGGNWSLTGLDMEGNGCKADIYVVFDPNLWREGHDNQIEAAVDHLLAELDG